MTMMRVLRVYTDETACLGDRKIFEIIAERARDAGLGDSTDIDAMIGMGRPAHARRRHFLENEGSVVIEIVDEDGKLRAFMAGLRDVQGVGLMTLEALEIVDLRASGDSVDGGR